MSTAVLVDVPIDLVHCIASFTNYGVLVTTGCFRYLVLVINGNVVASWLVYRKSTRRVKCGSPPISCSYIIGIFPVRVRFQLRVLFFTQVNGVRYFFQDRNRRGLRRLRSAIIRCAFINVALGLGNDLACVCFKAFRLCVGRQRTVSRRRRVTPSIATRQIQDLRAELTNGLMTTLSNASFTYVRGLRVCFLTMVIYVNEVITFSACLSTVSGRVRNM